jgi:hypothetical protein
MMTKAPGLLGIAGLTLLFACGGTETINGLIRYDPAVTTFEEMVAKVQSGAFCNGLPLVSVADQPTIMPGGENQITYVCSNAE